MHQARGGSHTHGVRGEVISGHRGEVISGHIGEVSSGHRGEVSSGHRGDNNNNNNFRAGGTFKFVRTNTHRHTAVSHSSSTQLYSYTGVSPTHLPGSLTGMQAFTNPYQQPLLLQQHLLRQQQQMFMQQQVAQAAPVHAQPHVAARAAPAQRGAKRPTRSQHQQRAAPSPQPRPTSSSTAQTHEFATQTDVAEETNDEPRREVAEKCVQTRPSTRRRRMQHVLP